jgi:hypothetical protein
MKSTLNPSLYLDIAPPDDTLCDLAAARETIFVFHAVDLGARKSGNIADFLLA